MSEKQEQIPADQAKHESAGDETSGHEASASHEVHAETDGVQKELVNVGFIMGIVLGTVVIVVGLILFGFTLTEVTSRDIRAQVLSATTYPDLREARASAAGLLNQYAVVDAAEGIYRIPIDHAIDILVNEQYQNQLTGDYSSELKLLPAN